jgi:hypothetical protein
MKKIIGISLFLVFIAVILVTGCTNSGTSPAPVSTVPTAIITTMVTSVQTTAPTPVVTSLSTTVATAIPTTIAPDPILHRWIRQYPMGGTLNGYEFTFYPGGILNYREGPISMISDNIKIEHATIAASGTWTKVGDNKYVVQFLPTGVSGAQIIREYTLVPAHEAKEYPGVVINDHIESSYETSAINQGQQRMSNEMYYPERAKID